MPRLWSAQGAPQIARRVAGGAAGGYAVAEHLADAVACPVRRFQHAARLDAAQHLKDLRRRDAVERERADPGEHVDFKPAHKLAAVAVRPLSPLDAVPLARHMLERARQRFASRSQRLGFACTRLAGLVGLALRAGINTSGQALARFGGALAGGLEAHGRIDAQRQALFFSGMPVLEAPVPATGWRQFQIKAGTVEVLAGLGQGA